MLIINTFAICLSFKLKTFSKILLSLLYCHFHFQIVKSNDYFWLVQFFKLGKKFV